MILPLAIFESLGVAEILLIVVVVLLLFGSTKIPELARNLGKAKAEFKRGEREGLRDLEREDDIEAVKRRARELGISTEGRTTEDLQKEIRARTT